MCLEKEWKANISPDSLRKVQRLVSSHSAYFPLGRAKRWYLKYGGNGFIQVTIITWLLDKYVS